ncbi:hypothetical protein T484DRAFT_1969630 [Baffinella frigidus]|nr:hypothetical protein T484DRAFT_1969630 [Cryptophyta sp. CCMP2293]
MRKEVFIASSARCLTLSLLHFLLTHTSFHPPSRLVSSGACAASLVLIAQDGRAPDPSFLAWCSPLPLRIQSRVPPWRGLAANPE